MKLKQLGELADLGVVISCEKGTEEIVMGAVKSSRKEQESSGKGSKLL
jgi:hypothetical protein